MIASKQFKEIRIIVTQEYYYNAEIAVTRKYGAKQIIWFYNLLFLLPFNTIFISKAYSTTRIKFLYINDSITLTKMRNFYFSIKSFMCKRHI